MSVNLEAAQLSDHLLIVVVFVYTFAMLAFAAEFAFGRRVSRTAGTPAREREKVLVTAGAGAAGGESVEGSADAGSGQAGRGGERERAIGPRAGKLAMVLTAVGFLLQVTEIVARGVAVDRLPWGNLCEFMVVVTCGAVGVFLAVALRYQARFAGLFVLIPVLVGLGLASTVLFIPAGAISPALHSYWIAIHVTAATVATSVFIMGAVGAVMYLLADRYSRLTAAGRDPGLAGIARRLPGTDVLDRLSYRMVVFGFPIWTFTVIAGAIWADQAWGHYWSWDPTETWSFITWIAYAGYLHSRVTAGWRGRRAAYIQVLAFTALLVNLFVINIYVNGMHSYSGL